MSRVNELKRELESAREAIEALDADLSAGRLDPEEHGRQRALREREAGRLFVSLRRPQREAQERAREGRAPGARPASMPGIEQEAPPRLAGREDARIPSQLQLAGVALDQGRLGEARRAY